MQNLLCYFKILAYVTTYSVKILDNNMFLKIRNTCNTNDCHVFKNTLSKYK